MQASRDAPPLLTEEWDLTLAEAVVAMKTKRMTDKPMRPGITWKWEKQEALYGTLFFMMIFLDRVAYGLSGGTIFLFLAPPDGGKPMPEMGYHIGMGWATLFMLVAAG